MGAGARAARVRVCTRARRAGIRGGGGFLGAGGGVAEWALTIPCPFSSLPSNTLPISSSDIVISLSPPVAIYMHACVFHNIKNTSKLSSLDSHCVQMHIGKLCKRTRERARKRPRKTKRRYGEERRKRQKAPWCEEGVYSNYY